jgi:hypothetical protein
MFSPKRLFRVAIPVATLALGATLYAHTRSNDCAHPSLVAKVMQATGMAKIQTCEVLTNFNGVCADPGKHCNIGNGAGKCENVPDPATGNLACQCVPNH